MDKHYNVKSKRCGANINVNFCSVVAGALADNYILSLGSKTVIYLQNHNSCTNTVWNISKGTWVSVRLMYTALVHNGDNKPNASEFLPLAYTSLCVHWEKTARRRVFVLKSSRGYFISHYFIDRSAFSTITLFPLKLIYSEIAYLY